jgi:hypothetical protein
MRGAPDARGTSAMKTIKWALIGLGVLAVVSLVVVF